MKSRALRLGTLALAGAVAAPAAFVPAAAEAAVTGNVGVFSKYVLRGMTNNSESDGAAIQGGFDYAHASGLYLGYWGSSLDYTDTAGSGGCKKVGDCSAAGFENDFYGGYAGKAGPIDYTAGVIFYYYLDMDNADGAEVAASASYMGAALGMKYLTKDVVWGNKGDIYWTLGYTAALPSDFKLGGTLGYYTYKKDGKYAVETADSEGSAFRHFDLKLSHPIGSSGADMSLTYVLGGKDRYGVDQADTMVLGVSYAFDVAK
jgi:uncharacterized protein (TIGR02001 family)